MIIEVRRDYVSSFTANGSHTQKLQAKQQVLCKFWTALSVPKQACQFRTVIQNPEPTSTIRNYISPRGNPKARPQNPDPFSGAQVGRVRKMALASRSPCPETPQLLRNPKSFNPLRKTIRPGVLPSKHPATLQKSSSLHSFIPLRHSTPGPELYYALKSLRNSSTIAPARPTGSGIHHITTEMTSSGPEFALKTISTMFLVQILFSRPHHHFLHL